MNEPMDAPDDPRRDVLPLIPHLRSYARSLTPRDPDLADDLVQDTLMLALKAWQRFTPGTNLKAWLFKILHNRFYSVVGRKHVRAEIASEHLDRLGSVPAFQEAAPEVSEFKLAFARLSPSHREVLVLHAVQGLPYERIAEICGCEIGTVKSRINRARNILKEMLLGDQPLKGSPRPWRAQRQTAAINGKLLSGPIVVASPVLAAPEPILVRPAPALIPAPVPVIPVWRRPWLSEVERQIAEVELQIRRHRGVLEELARAGVVTAGAEAALWLSEQRLALFSAHHERLLDGNTPLRSAPTQQASSIVPQFSHAGLDGISSGRVPSRS